MTRLLVPLLLLLGCSHGGDSGAEPRELPGEARTHTLDHGRERSFRVYRPSGRSGPLPVVLAFHGGGGSVPGMVRMSGLEASAEVHGFLAVFPAGTGRRADRLLTWNAGRCCGSAAAQGVDDVGFVAALIDVLAREYDIDHRRVYATGHSNGAQMSYRLACELPDRIAAIAPNGAQGVLEDCAPSRPVPVLHLHGTLDRCARYEGGECGGCFAEMLGPLGWFVPDNRWSCASVPDAVATWAERNGCSGSRELELARGDLRCEHFTGCPASGEVALCSFEGAGHTWAGGRYGAPFCERDPDGRRCRRYREIVGEISRDASANELMWRFFQRHALP